MEKLGVVSYELRDTTISVLIKVSNTIWHETRTSWLITHNL